MTRRSRIAGPGFVLPVVLGLMLLAALLAQHAATELGSTTLMATQHQLHQYAFETAESGLRAAIQQLQVGMALPQSQALHSPVLPGYAATIETTTSVIDLPEGFSAGRIKESRYEIHSTGHGAQNSTVTVTQGVRQLGINP